MSEVRRLSNRSSLSKVDHLTGQNSSKNKKSKVKAKVRSLVSSKPNAESLLTLENSESFKGTARSDIDEYFRELTNIPSHKLDYDNPRINVKVDNQYKGAKATYKLKKPIQCSDEQKYEVSSIITNLIKENAKKYPPLTIANDLNYQFESVSELMPLLRKYISEKMHSKSLPPKTSSKYVYNRVDQLLAQEGQYMGNDNIDLSFDGKALDKNDILKIVDSFSVAFEDDKNDDEDDNEYVDPPKNILPREVSGVF